MKEDFLKPGTLFKHNNKLKSALGMKKWGLLLLISLLFMVGCGDKGGANKASGIEEGANNEGTIPKEALNGKALSEMYCGTCHQIPVPGDLDKKTWQRHILVRMAAFMGIYWDGVQYYDQMPEKWLEPGPGGVRVSAAKIYPDRPLMKREEWEAIVKYYTEGAPEKLNGATRYYSIAGNTDRFKVRFWPGDTNLAPVVTAVKMDPREKAVYAGFYKQGLLRYNLKGKEKGRAEGYIAPVQIEVGKKNIAVLDIGSMIGMDNPLGTYRRATSWKKLRKGKVQEQKDSLQRPVHIAKGDLNGDGREDRVICEYGKYLGQLSWEEQNEDGTYTSHVLFPDDGAICAHIHDFNSDGKMDFVVLMGNSDEGIDLYLNQGAGEFRKKRLFRFNPTYGSTGMDVLDWDGDGDQDLLYWNGDNADYPPILKPHHGIRLYLNNGDLNFSEAFYLPLNGAYGVKARDFDLDGDMDLAAVSFYPDYENSPEESFVYYENQGGTLTADAGKMSGSSNNQFIAATFPGYNLGRWMVLDVADVDRDGDEDIMLGAFSVKTAEVPVQFLNTWINQNKPLVLLENTTK